MFSVHDQDNSKILYDIKKAGTVRESKDTCTKDWIDMATEIANSYDDYDGFVILHGTDTMAYTASALSFMLENLGKPVVLTGAQVSHVEISKCYFVGWLSASMINRTIQDQKIVNESCG